MVPAAPTARRRSRRRRPRRSDPGRCPSCPGSRSRRHRSRRGACRRRPRRTVGGVAKGHGAQIVDRAGGGRLQLAPPSVEESSVPAAPRRRSRRRRPRRSGRGPFPSRPRSRSRRRRSRTGARRRRPRPSHGLHRRRSPRSDRCPCPSSACSSRPPPRRLARRSRAANTVRPQGRRSPTVASGPLRHSLHPPGTLARKSMGARPAGERSSARDEPERPEAARGGSAWLKTA